jgi:hypothetical protein
MASKTGRYVTLKNLEENPELGIEVLLFCVLQIPGMYTDPQFELLLDWILAIRAPRRKDALQLRDEVKAPEMKDMMAEHWSGRPGRPAKRRKIFMMAYVRQQYLQPPLDSWSAITKRLCDCGENHDDRRILKRCRKRLESGARTLKQLLRACEIELPERPMVPFKSATGFFADWVPENRGLAMHRQSKHK